MTRDWQGGYYDGRSAVRHQVAVEVTSSGLRISVEGEARLWPYEEIRPAPRHHRDEPLRLERGTGLAETLVVTDPEFLAALYQAAPQLRRRFERSAPRTSALRTVLSAGVALVLIISLAYFWAIPTFADQVASRIPQAWEEGLGAMAVDEIAPRSVRCTDPALIGALETIVVRLKSSAPEVPYTFRITVVDYPMVNALAAPGGYIVIYRGLLEKTGQPEELAGVLAHEMQHVIQRHGTRALVRHMSLRLFIALATGGGFSGQLAGQVAALRYSRDAEIQADREGMRLIQAARIDPQAMIRAYVRLREEGGRTPTFVRYLSTHPDIDERIALLRRLPPPPSYEPVPISLAVPWQTLTASCRPGRP